MAATSHALKDDRRVVVRPIGPDDREQLLGVLDGLGDESRYKRFHSPVTSISRRHLDYLVDVDHHDHEALLALDEATDRAVGVARFVRTDDEVAECAVVVIDDWQGHGVGAVLLDELADRAREEGVRRFLALVLADNAEALGLLERLGEAERRRLGHEVELDIELGEREGGGEPLHTLLRGAAAGTLTPLATLWRMVPRPRRRPGPDEARANEIVVAAGPASAPALDQAAGLAGALGSRLHVVAAYRPVLSSGDDAERELEATARAARERGVEVEPHLLHGDVVDAILDVAHDTAARLIVVDAGEPPWPMPRPADRISHRAPCDVLVARG